MRRVLNVLLAGTILIFALMAVERAFTLNVIHGWVEDHFGDVIGPDQTVGWLVALALLALLRLIPLRSWLAPLTGGAKALLAFAALCLTAAGALKLINARFPFDPTGAPRQSYVETANGPVILDEPPGGTDRKTGLIRQPLTAEILRTISMEKNTGKPWNDPNRYFNPYDGKNKTWFVADTCETRDHDGYDDRGRKLKPATAELAERCEKQRTEDERSRQRESDAKARREQREQQKVRRQRFQDIGTYEAIGRHITVDHVKFFFEEAVVLRHETRLKLRVIGLTDNDGAANGGAFELSLMNADGSETQSSGIRKVQGAIAVASSNSALMAPSPGEAGSVVIEFARDSETAGGFAIAINHAAAFNNPASHIAAFRKF